MKKILVLFSALLGACAIQSREAQLPSWKVVGLGEFSCEEYLRQSKADASARMSFNHWLMGYITGRNSQERNIDRVLGVRDLNVMDLVDPQDKAPMDWLDEYCANNPATPFHMAARRYVDERIWYIHWREIKDNRKDQNTLN